MDEFRGNDPYGTLISIVTVREHEIGKMRRKISDLKARLEKTKNCIEVEKRRELELLDAIRDNIKKETELRSRIASLNASIELAIKFKNENLNRIEEEKLKLNESKKRHNACILEKQKLWNQYLAVYSSLDSTKKVAKEEGVLKLLNFELKLIEAQVVQMKKEDSLLTEIQEKIKSTLIMKTEALKKDNLAMRAQIEAMEKQKMFKVEEHNRLKQEFESLNINKVHFKLISSPKNFTTTSTPVSTGKEQSVTREFSDASVMNWKDSLTNRADSQTSTISRAATQPSLLLTNLLSLPGLSSITSFRPRKRIEEVDPFTKKLMLKLEEDKRSIARRSTESFRHTPETHTCPQLSQTNIGEVDEPVDQLLLPPLTASATCLPEESTHFSQSQSDGGFFSQSTIPANSQLTHESQRNEPHTQTMFRYPSQTSVAKYRAEEQTTEAPNHGIIKKSGVKSSPHFKVEFEPMDDSKSDQSSYNPPEVPATKFKTGEQKVYFAEPEMDTNTFESVEDNNVVESEYFLSKKDDQKKARNLNSIEDMKSIEQMDVETHNEDRPQTPMSDVPFMMSPVCSPMPAGGLLSPPPPSSLQTFSNLSAFDFFQKRSGPSTTSGGGIFKMF